MVTKSEYKINVESSESGAVYSIQNSKSSHGEDFYEPEVINGKMKINRKGRSTLRCVFLDGSNSDIVIKRKINRHLLWNVFNYGIGIGVDAYNGRFYKPRYKYYYFNKVNDSTSVYPTKRKPNNLLQKAGDNNWVLGVDYMRPSVSFSYSKLNAGKYNNLLVGGVRDIKINGYFNHFEASPIFGTLDLAPLDLSTLYQQNDLATNQFINWFGDGINMNFEEYKFRSVFNSTDSRYLEAKATNKGLDDIDNLELINATYFANLKLLNIKTYKEYYDEINAERKLMRASFPIWGRILYPNVKRKYTGFVSENSIMSLIKPNFNEKAVNNALVVGFKDMRNLKSVKFKSKLLGETQVHFASSQVNRRKNRRRKRRNKAGKPYYTEQQLFNLMVEDAYSQGMDRAKLLDPKLSLRSSVYKNPRLKKVEVKIGIEDGLTAGRRFATYEKVIKSNGKVKWKYRGALLSTNKVSPEINRDSSSFADILNNTSKFIQYSKFRKVKNGYEVKEITTFGHELSLRTFLSTDSVNQHSGFSMRYARDLSKMKTSKKKYSQKYKKFPLGVKWFAEYKRGSSLQKKNGIGDKLIENVSPLYIDSLGLLGRAKVISHTLSTGLSKEFYVVPGLQLVPYFSVGLGYELISKNDFKNFYYVVDDYFSQYSIQKEDDSRGFGYSASYNVGTRIKVPLKINSAISMELNWYHSATFTSFILPYGKEGFSLSFAYSKYF
jgi:hypothetical protein